MRNLRLMFLAVLGFTLVACGGEATDGEIVGSVEQAADSCYCPTVIDPVCGVDGKTYDNACLAECEGVKVAYEGECRPTMCPAVWDPVCGVDGNTYGNACEAGVAGVEIAHEGECLSVKPGPWGNLAGSTDGDSDDRNDDRCFCPMVIDPVCGVDGKTYDNACVAACEDVKVDYEGECKE